MPRVLVGELMDNPGLDPAEHAHALRGLARINALSGVTRSLYPILRDQARRLDRPLTIADIATGSGDLPVALLRRAARDRVRFEVIACDVSQWALEQARRRAQSAGVELHTKQLDILVDTPPTADVITCALFLHHLQDEHVRPVLTRLIKAAGTMLLVSDLRRGWWGTTLAATVPRLVTRSRIVHVDALRSARAALSTRELREHVREVAGPDGWIVSHAFPGRMLLRWTRTSTSTRS